MQVSSIYKAQKGLIKVSAEMENGSVKSIQITGDFFMYPEESLPTLERLLVGTKVDPDELKKVLDGFYKSGVTTPHLTKEDFVNAIMACWK